MCPIKFRKLTRLKIQQIKLVLNNYKHLLTPGNIAKLKASLQLGLTRPDILGCSYTIESSIYMAQHNISYTSTQALSVVNLVTEITRANRAKYGLQETTTATTTSRWDQYMNYTAYRAAPINYVRINTV